MVYDLIAIDSILTPAHRYVASTQTAALDVVRRCHLAVVPNRHVVFDTEYAAFLAMVHGRPVLRSCCGRRRWRIERPDRPDLARRRSDRAESRRVR